MREQHILVTCVIMGLLAGCAGPQDGGRQPAAKPASLSDQQKLEQTAAANTKLQVQIEELTGQLKAAREQVARTEQERKEMRDELLRMKIAQEEAQRARERQAAAAAGTPTRKEPTMVAPPPDTGAPPSDPELKRRLRDLVRELEELLQKR